jgi:hypothetical protein
MKKLVFGCLFVVVILAIVGGILGYVYVVEPARSYLVAFRQLGNLSDLDKNVKNTAAFRAPASGELTESLVKRFASVQEAMQTGLGAQLQQIEQRYKQLSGSLEGGAKPDARTVFTALKDLVGVLAEAKRIQVDALNRVGFSVTEYQWVRGQVYAAAGASVAQLDFKAIWDAAQKGTFDVEPTRTGGAGEVPERNKELVKPYLDKIPKWTALAWAGL